MMNKMMKKIAVAFAAATMAISAVSVTAFANDGMGINNMNVSINCIDKTMYVRPAEGCNVRKAPSTDAERLTGFNYNEQLHVVGQTTNGWYEVIVTDPTHGGECSGFIAGNLLSDTKGAEQSHTNSGVNPNYTWIKETNSSHSSQVKAERGEMSHDNDTFTVNVASGYLALRSAPETNPANEIGQLHNGQMVQVQNYGTQFDYVYVPATGAYGYVNNDYLMA